MGSGVIFRGRDPASGTTVACVPRAVPRRHRQSTAGLTFHVMNRGAKRAALFETADDYGAFIGLLDECLNRFDVALFAYCLMQNHWHLLLSPRMDGALSTFMHWLTTTHARRWQCFRCLNGQGAVYQGRFKAVPVCDDEHFLWVCRYIERNPLRAGLVASARDWRWSSLGQRVRQLESPRISTWPVPMPAKWTADVDAAQTAEELDAIRRCIKDGRPIGVEEWSNQVLARMGIVRSRPRGRPAKKCAAMSSKMTPDPL
jgi:putative transposase